jgi:hypothetical protein
VARIEHVPLGDPARGAHRRRDRLGEAQCRRLPAGRGKARRGAVAVEGVLVDAAHVKIAEETLARGTDRDLL